MTERARAAAERIVELKALQEELAALRGAGLTIAFTNGCFDLLHAGHIALLEAAAGTADRLVVGMNSDASLARLKGPSRPLVGQESRALILAALRPVDYVLIFDEDTPQRVIEAILPDVLIKGADYPLEEIVGREVVEAHGGRVLRVPLLPGHSTSGLLRRIQPGEER
jgi:D-beta-D-heptose 7-phosphate kinase/D-beta-D-heptose 1-phosphate adenosyltransferase